MAGSSNLGSVERISGRWGRPCGSVALLVDNAKLRWGRVVLPGMSSCASRIRGLSFGLVAAIVIILGWGHPAAAAGWWSGGAQRIAWGRPTPIAPGRLLALACPSASRCVALDDRGDAVSSTDPTAGQRWKVVAGADPNIDQGLQGLSCPSRSLCVGYDEGTDLLIDHGPPDESSSWSVTRLDSSVIRQLRGLSCPSVSLCVAVDSQGDVITATDPTGGPGAWASAHVDNAQVADSGCAETGDCQAPLTGVACPSTSFCVTVDATGSALISVIRRAGRARGREPRSTPMRLTG